VKYLGYVLRNARRNPLRSMLTVASIAICLFPVMLLLSYFRVNEEINASAKGYNQLITMNQQGLGGGSVPISLAREIETWHDAGVLAATPYSWFGGKVGDLPADFAQFAVDPEAVFAVNDALTVSPEQLEAFRNTRSGCIIGRKLAVERSLKVGDKLLLKRDLYPVDLDLDIVGIYDGPPKADLRTVFFSWDFLEETLKASPDGQRMAGNAGTVFFKCKSAEAMPALITKVDEYTRNSDTPTRTQDLEAFGTMFMEMIGDFRYYILCVGIAVVFVLAMVAGVAMAMSMRERTTEIAVLKAIGFSKGRVLFLVLAEATLVAAIGGAIGAFGTQALFQVVDGVRLFQGFLPVFYIPWRIALFGFSMSVLIGLVSGFIPAVQASRLSVINGLRKVV
jgi:putative ABC transport system permease protein